MLPNLKYYDVRNVQDDNYAVSVQNLTLMTETVPEGCDPCAWIDHTFLAYTQAMFLGLTGILSSVSMVGFFLVFWKGREILSSLAYLVPVEEEGSTWKDMVRKKDWTRDWKPPSEIYIIENRIYNFLVFWARCDGA